MLRVEYGLDTEDTVCMGTLTWFYHIYSASKPLKMNTCYVLQNICFPRGCQKGFPFSISKNINSTYKENGYSSSYSYSELEKFKIP